MAPARRPALTIDRFALYRTADEGAAAAATSLCETLADSETFELQCIRRWAKTSLLYTTHAFDGRTDVRTDRRLDDQKDRVAYNAAR